MCTWECIFRFQGKYYFDKLAGRSRGHRDRSRELLFCGFSATYTHTYVARHVFTAPRVALYLVTFYCDYYTVSRTMRHSLRLVVTRHADCCIRIIFDCFIPSVIIVPSLSSSSGCPRHPTSSVRCKYTRRLRRRLLDFSRESRGCVDSIIVVRHEHQSHRFHSLSFRPWVSLFLFATLLPSPLPLSLVKRGKDSGGSAPVLITILKREASKVINRSISGSLHFNDRLMSLLLFRAWFGRIDDLNRNRISQ